MEITFCELRHKEVINIADGKRLGRVVDIVLNCKTGKVCGIIVPGERCSGFFRRIDELFIPWCDIRKIGEDVLIVELKNVGCQQGCQQNPPPCFGDKRKCCRGFQHGANCLDIKGDGDEDDCKFEKDDDSNHRFRDIKDVINENKEKK